MEYKFQRHRIDKISREKMFDELEKAAKVFHYIEFGWRDFDKVAAFGANTVKREFGSWKKALSALRELLNKKGLDLSPRPFAPQRIHSDNDMFDEMDRIWQSLGHRPSRNEWESVEPKISYNTYKIRFGGWQNACLKFIEYKMGGQILLDKEIEDEKVLEKTDGIKDIVKSGRSRTVTLADRLKVLDRDNYRCVFCGRSPATEVGVRLHIDHKIPFSTGGKSTVDNLQTLCQDCNLGKSDSVLKNR